MFKVARWVEMALEACTLLSRVFGDAVLGLLLYSLWGEALYSLAMPMAHALESRQFQGLS